MNQLQVGRRRNLLPSIGFHAIRNGKDSDQRPGADDDAQGREGGPKGVGG
jgi:hypothetical protein